MKSAAREAEILEARAFLRGKIIERATLEGAPLTALEIDYLDSDHLPNEREIDERFNREHDFQEYIQRLGGLLRRSRDNDAASDPQALARYESAAKQLDEDDNDLVLFSIAVLGLREPGTKVIWFPEWLPPVVVLLALGIVGYYSCKAAGLSFWGLFR